MTEHEAVAHPHDHVAGDHVAHDHLVHEAIGESLTPLQASATVGVGINSLMILGVLPVLLGALADEHRLDATQMGLAAMLEVLCMAASTGAMGLIRRPRRLRLIAVAASVGLALLDLACMWGSGAWLLAVRGAAGAVEGVLLWITVSMIARTVTPERWAAVFFTAQTVGQLILAMVLAVAVMPTFGASGGFAALAVTSLLGVVPALFAPSRFAPLPVRLTESEAPPPRGWIALIATAIFVSGGGAINIYLQPLAHQDGLGGGVVRTAIWVSLIGQVVGGGLATVMAGRVKYFTVFVWVSLVYIVSWVLLGVRQPGWTFVAINVIAGVAGLFMAPFLVPMTIDADPSRRTAVQSGAAQLLGGALGPLLGAFVVDDRNARGVIPLGVILLLVGMAAVAWLRFTHKEPVEATA